MNKLEPFTSLSFLGFMFMRGFVFVNISRGLHGGFSTQFKFKFIYRARLSMDRAKQSAEKWTLTYQNKYKDYDDKKYKTNVSMYEKTRTRDGI